MMGGEEKRSSPVSRGNAGNRRISDDDDDSADASLLRSLSLGNFSSPDSFVKTLHHTRNETVHLSAGFT